MSKFTHIEITGLVRMDENTGIYFVAGENTDDLFDRLEGREVHITIQFED